MLNNGKNYLSTGAGFPPSTGTIDANDKYSYGLPMSMDSLCMFELVHGKNATVYHTGELQDIGSFSHLTSKKLFVFKSGTHAFELDPLTRSIIPSWCLHESKVVVMRSFRFMNFF